MKYSRQPNQQRQTDAFQEHIDSDFVHRDVSPGSGDLAGLVKNGTFRIAAQSHSFCGSACNILRGAWTIGLRHGCSSMRQVSAQRLALALLTFLAAVGITIGVASAAENEASRDSAVARPLLGVRGDPARFKNQTGQSSIVSQAFLGWGHGQTFGAPFAQLFEQFGPIPMFHLGTGGKDRREVITPAAIAAGEGDSYLIALNNAISSWGKGLYVRPMAEMNSANSFYSGFNTNGTPKNAAHAPARYREAFSRIYMILHGGTASAVNAKLRALGLPPVKGGVPLPNPFPQLRIVWAPLVPSIPKVPGNTPSAYFPGKAYVDVLGGDIYNVTVRDSAQWTGLEALFTMARNAGKPFSIPEFGLTADSPAAVRHMCSFLKVHPTTEVLVFYESASGSRYDLGSRPQSRAAYRACITPLAGGFPTWAAANVPGGGARLLSLKLTPRPAAGATPLAVEFAIAAKLSVPIRRWLLVFDDGKEAGGDGAPPATVTHTYANAGIYPATLIVFPFPPFSPAFGRFYVSAPVTVGTGARPIVRLLVKPGKAPLTVSAQIDVSLDAPATSWRVIWDDGKSLTANGAPPQFTGHTYAKAGTYNVLLIVKQADGRRYLVVTKIVVAPPAA